MARDSCKNGCPSADEMAQMQQWFDQSPAVAASQGCDTRDGQQAQPPSVHADSSAKNRQTIAQSRA
jgi:hypothetical protein